MLRPKAFGKLTKAPAHLNLRRIARCYAVGKCYLVGAGIGPEHMTMKAVRLLESADVVVYDDLGAREALAYAGQQCQQVYVGKRGGNQESAKQLDIDELLVRLCQEGKQVVRLKGGCPSVFSRVASELKALSAAGCAYEMVPGISSALAAPILAGFPLTDVKISTSFAVVSGHDVAGTDWSVFLRIPTLVVLMAGRALGPLLAPKLISLGWESDTPVCVIRSAGSPDQRVWTTTLERAAVDLEGEKLSPCITVIGRIVALPASLLEDAGAAQQLA